MEDTVREYVIVWVGSYNDWTRERIDFNSELLISATIRRGYRVDSRVYTTMGFNLVDPSVLIDMVAYMKDRGINKVMMYKPIFLTEQLNKIFEENGIQVEFIRD